MESTDKQGLHPPSHDSQQHLMPTEEPLSGVDNQIKAEFMTVRTDLVCRDETMLTILRSQAKQIQTITDLLAEHNRVIGIGKGNMVISGPGPSEQLGGAGLAPSVAFVRPKTTKNSKVAVQYGAQKLGVGQAGQKGVSKHVKKEGEPGAPKPMFQRKLEFREEEDSDFGELRNIRQRGLGSPFRFYTHTGWQMTSQDMPTCMDICFWPPPGMQFFGHELAVAAYVFAQDLEQSELLVQNDHCVDNREALWTLRPGEEVVDDVINLVVAMLTAGKDHHRWWLPRTFSQIALHPAFHCKSTLDYIKAKYMGLADNLLKIYVSLHSGCHWYLMIVDMWEEKLVYLDLLKRTSEREGRINQMLAVARFIDQMLADKSCYEKQNITPKKVSNFKVFEPLVSQQAEDSMDCGVWVSQWMTLTHLWASYELEEVNDSTRMALAIDLVMGSHNPIAEEVAEKARRYWDRSNRASYKKGKRQGKKANSPTGPLSPSI
ncbi:Ulp1 protease family, carboxy-terminal domain protein [Arachis hypogaea]|nr:Ulp1 protease family, carboxy-terminal domain protein [Arachis hypogaea]